MGTALGIAIAGSITGASGAGKVGPSFVEAAHPLWWTIVGAGLLVVVLASLSNTSFARRSTDRVATRLREPAPST